MKTLMIGIAGGTGSGKTTLVRRLSAELGSSITVLSHDDYYKAHDELSYEQRCKLNYDHPGAFDTELLVSHLAALRRGESITAPTYDFTVHNRSSVTKTVQPNRILLLEGILILADPAICRELDIRIFVDTDADVRLLRRIKRDMRDRGRSLESITEQYLTTVKPMHEQFVEPSRKNADIVIPQGGKNSAALALLLGRAREFLRENS